MQREIKFTEDEIARYYHRRMPQLAQRGIQWRGQCPVHGGEGSNFAVDPNTGLWFCHSKCGRGGDIFELEKDLEDLTFLEARTSVFRIVGRDAATLRSVERTEFNAQDSISSRGYLYRAADGSPAYRKIRQGDGSQKSFYFQRQASNGEWRNGLGKTPRLLYRLPELRQEQRVYYTEGEKDVETLVEAGLVATTSGGSDDWRIEFATEFRDKDVIVLFDNDEPGRRHARRVSEAIHRIARTVKVFELPGLPVGGDVTDWLAMGHTVGELEQLVKACPAFDPTSNFPLLVQPPSGGSSMAPKVTPISTAVVEIARLADLDEMDYDRQRKAEAKRMGIRVTTLDGKVAQHRVPKTRTDNGAGMVFELDDPEPWPESVNGAELLDEIEHAFSRYVVLAPHAVEAQALWTLHAHTHDSAHISPILTVSSPVLGCGKTTDIYILAKLTPRPLEASNITTASLFRAIERWRPTFLIDEADSFLRDDDQLRGILNSGHNRAMAYVIRTVGEDHEPKRFTTWCPKAIALIGNLPATLASRSIHIEMRRLKAGETVEPCRPDRLAHLEPLARKAWRWGRDHLEDLRVAEPDMPPTLRGRSADNWRHLLAIADVAGGRWPQRARLAAESLENANDGEATGVVLLNDMAALFERRGAGRLSSEDVVEALSAMEDRPWPEYKGGRPLSKRQLANLLKGFGVEPRVIRMESGSTPRGYVRDDFNDAFARYLPSQSATTQQTNSDRASSDFRSVTGEGRVADRNSTKANTDRACCAVALREPLDDGFDEEEHF